MLLTYHGSGIAHVHLTGDDLTVVHILAALVLLNVVHDELGVGGLDDTVVGNLAAHFGVHGCLVQHQDGITLGSGLLQLVLGNNGQDLSIGDQGFVADKLGGGHIHILI